MYAMMTVIILNVNSMRVIAQAQKNVKLANLTQLDL